MLHSDQVNTDVLAIKKKNTKQWKQFDEIHTIQTHFL